MGWNNLPYVYASFEIHNAYETVTAAPTISNIAVSATTVKPGNTVTVMASVFDGRGVSSVNMSTTPVLFATSGTATFNQMNQTAYGTWSSSFVIAEDALNGPVALDFNVTAWNKYNNVAWKSKRVTFTVDDGKGSSSGGGRGGSTGGSKPTSSGAKHPGPKGHGTGSSSGSGGGVHKHWSTSTSGGSKGGASVNVGVGVNVDINA